MKEAINWIREKLIEKAAKKRGLVKIPKELIKISRLQIEPDGSMSLILPRTKQELKENIQRSKKFEEMLHTHKDKERDHA